MRWPVAIFVIVAALMSSTIVATSEAPAAQAAVASQFDAGNIISDATMYNGAAMSASDAQTFLRQKQPTCSGACLANFTQNTPSIAGVAGRCGPYAGAANERAADIIAKVGAACGISQKTLLVLVEKEQSLVSSRNASDYAINHATGFSCPDSAPCDPAYSGFFYQMYYAARQFVIYAASPNSFNYLAGRYNTILYSPNCSLTSSVFIQNKATAGLYDYTPYQPNAEALNHLYGNGDACSSYGNRNFWRIFTDWFGSPTVNSSLLRTVNDASVYLVSGNYKYPISSSAIFGALGPLGPVGYVSQQYLDGFTTSNTVGRSLRDPSGSIYFYDAGIKLSFTSCAQAVDYGASCAGNGYVQLTQDQINAFITGPVLTNVLGTNEGGRYYIKSGTKAEILDDQSQTQAGIPLGMAVLSENAVAGFTLAAPIVRDGVFVNTRTSSTYSLLSQGARYEVASGDESGLGVTARTAGSLLADSLAKIPASSTPYAGVVTTPGATATTILEQAGRYTVSAGGLSPSITAVPVSQNMVNSFPDQGSLDAGAFIKSPQKADVYVIMPTNIRPIAGWDALLALTPSGHPQISTVSQSLIGQLTIGPTALTGGSLVRSADNATVYYVNGVTNRIALSSFEYTSEAGFTNLVYAPNQVIQGYPLATQLMTFGFSCGTDRYVSAGGQVHLVASAQWAEFPFDYVPLDQFSCQQLNKGATAAPFIRTEDGSIYQLVGGQKRPIGSMARFTQLSAGQGYLNVLPRFANTYPTGPAA